MTHVQPAVRTDGFLTAATGSQSLLAVPLVQGQHRLGVLVFGSSHPEKFARDDLIKAELLAAQAGGRHGERQALRRAGPPSRRGRSAVRAEPGHAACPHGPRHRLRAAGDPAPPPRLRPRGGVPQRGRRARRWCRSPWPRTRGRSSRSTAAPGAGLSAQLVDPTLRRVAATGEAVRLDGADDGDHQFLHEGMQTRLTVPLNLGDRVLGVVDLETSRAQAYAGPGGRTIMSLGHSAALAIENRRAIRGGAADRDLPRARPPEVGAAPDRLARAAHAAGLDQGLHDDADRARPAAEPRGEAGVPGDHRPGERSAARPDRGPAGHVEDRGRRAAARPPGAARWRSWCSRRSSPWQATRPSTISRRPSRPTCLPRSTRERIRQVLHNLLENAVKYSPDGGMIRVQARREDGAVVISVLDQGIGIPPPRPAARVRSLPPRRQRRGAACRRQRARAGDLPWYR